MFGLRWLLRQFKILPNAYYNYLQNRTYEANSRKVALKNEIRELYHDHCGTLGYRLISDLLARKNIFCSYPTTYKYMNEMGIKATLQKKKLKYTKGLTHKTFGNLLNQDFKANKPNEKWCTDFTYLELSNGKKRYNCSIIDLYDRSVVASRNSQYIDSKLAITTLKLALQSHKPSNEIILHSDQGSQFASASFTEYCMKNSIVQSMSKAGCPYDNAPMERYYNTLKNEFTNHYSFETDYLLNQAINDFAYVWYNHQRPHTYNNKMTPSEARSAYISQTI